MRGSCTICATPSVAMETNQTRQIGPNQVATFAVPRRWTMNRAIRKNSAAHDLDRQA